MFCLRILVVGVTIIAGERAVIFFVAYFGVAAELISSL
jgi:hypothetical protein